MKNGRNLILDAVANPDEAYVDPTGAVHVLEKVGSVSDFLVVIYGLDGECLIRTAYYTSSRRKARRYRTFRKLKTS